MFLIEFLRYILELFFDITGSYGVSILLLSLTVTILMLPLFWLAEIIQNKEKARKAKMQPLLDQIKEVDNKQEKFYYTKEIYRKYQYSPFYALTGILGLLIQVPFFLAVYWMLLEYKPLQGVSFGLIKDLSQPDGLIELGGLSINLLPFIMTFVNLFAGYLYSKDKSERVQLLIIAFVFLFLLYNLPAALVLYWTMNNVFSIGKNWLLSNVKLPKLEQIITNQISRLAKHRYLIYPLLFSIFPLLSVYYTNIAEVEFSRITTILFVILFFTLILLVTAKVIFRDNSKVILFGVLALVLFFSFGHIRELLLNTSIKFFGRYSILGASYIVLFFLTSFYLFKTKINLEKVAKVFSIISISLFFIITTRILVNNVSTKENSAKQSTVNLDNIEKKENTYNSLENYPDIYYIIYDGYANSRILKENLNYDNSDFERALEERGFYIAKDSRSNYMITYLSLAATLNMNYINYLKDDLGVDSKETKVPFQMISDNKVVKYLKNKGYKIVQFSSGWHVTGQKTANTDYYYKTNLISEFNTTFLQTTILLPIINYITRTTRFNHVMYTLNTIHKIDNIKEPKFVFAHVVSPHHPYLFDENGEPLTSDVKITLENYWGENDKKYYLDQIKFINKKTKELIDGIINKSNNAIIIIQSDHGSAFLGKDWKNPSTEFIQERGKILNAILINDREKQALYPKISSVNTFRLVFNNVFQDNFELLNDSTFFSREQTPYDFIDVTDIINSQK